MAKELTDPNPIAKDNIVSQFIVDPFMGRKENINRALATKTDYVIRKNMGSFGFLNKKQRAMAKKGNPV